MRRLVLILAATASGLWAQEAPKAAGEMACMEQHKQTATLIDQVAKSFAEIQNEKDPGVLQKKLAAHGALIQQLQAKTAEMGPMHDKMHSEMQEKMKQMKGDKSEKPAETQAPPAGHQH